MRDRINILKAHDIRSMNVIIEKVGKESGQDNWKPLTHTRIMVSTDVVFTI